MESLNLAIAEHPFGKELPQKYIERLAEGAKLLTFKPGEYIFREGQESDYCYLLKQGKAAVEIYSPTRQAITIQTVGEGEVLGWSWIVPPFRRHLDARAIDVVRAIAIEGGHLRKMCEEDHDLGYELLKRFVSLIVSRLQMTRLQLLDVYGGQ
jgi:CRP-like cAMP-binding protein